MRIRIRIRNTDYYIAMSSSVNYANPASAATFYIDPDPTLKLSKVNDLKFYCASILRKYVGNQYI